MGRRALRQIDPQLDLSDHYLDWEDVPAICSSVTLFNNSAPLELEIGSGKGLFLRSAAGELPHRNFLGIEISRKYARHAAAGLARLGCGNARVIHGDANALVGERIVPGSLAAVHIYFPDPWWKKRHRRRRIMQPAFVARVQQLLQVAGKLHFWTDVLEYYETALETLAQHTQLAGPFPVAEQRPEHDLDYRTHFERRTRLHREAVYRAEFILPGEPPETQARADA